MIRKPVAAGFYQGDIKTQMETYRRAFRPVAGLPERIVAGIVPHAGWFFSGPTAAKVFLSIAAKESPKTFVIFGAVHVPGVRVNSVFASGAWDTPLGPVEVDEDLAVSLLAHCGSVLSPGTDAHLYEHSIEVQLPMIKYLFPEAKVVPVAVPPGESAVELGSAVGRMIRSDNLDAVVIASTDLTHYGDNYGFTPAGLGPDGYEWMRENDGHIIGLALKMMPDEILTEAAMKYNACGPGAMAGAVAAARAMGVKEGKLIEYMTSHDVYPQGGFTMGVGYAGIVF